MKKSLIFSFSLIGMIKRNYSNFNHPYPLKYLYTTINCPLLQYAPITSIHMKTYNIGHSEQIEKIPKQYASFYLL